jgi:hypothetical protein
MTSSTIYAEFVACYEAVGSGNVTKEICAQSKSGRQHRKTTKVVLRQ